MDQLREVGLARALSKLGHSSRSRAASLIREGRIKLNGVVQRNPAAPVSLGRDRIEVDGQALARVAKVYLMLNKPRGVVTTAADEKNRATVYAFLGQALPWVAPVGRLDKASEGMLLLTNDTEWGARVTDPASHVEKTYHVQIRAVPSVALVGRLLAGVTATNGELLRAKRAEVVRAGERHGWLAVTLDEGKNRHIRRMLESLHIEVLRLVRVRIGDVELGDLAKGKYRSLTARERSGLGEVTAASTRREALHMY